MVLLLMMPLSWADEPSLVSRERLLLGDITQTSWQLQVGAHGYDKVGLERYRVKDAPQIAAVLFLPGTYMNGRATVLDENHNLWLYLANRGVTVYAMNYRTHYVPHDEADTRVMRNWGMERFVGDAERLARFVTNLDDMPMFVAGFSRGVGYAYALAGRVDFAGLISLDGSFKAYRETPYDRDEAMSRLEESGKFVSVLSSRGYEWRRNLMATAAENPNGPANDPDFDSAGAHLASVLHRAWGRDVLANTSRTLTPVDVLGQHMLDFDWYFPQVQNIQARAIASRRDHPATDLDDHWGNMTLPILHFSASNMGGDMVLNGIYSASKSGSQDVTLHLLEGYGHTDVLTATSARGDVYEVIRQWIESHSAH